MTICQDPWTDRSSQGPIDIDTLRRERIGQYLVQDDRSPTSELAHIISAVTFGEERASGVADVELSVHCRLDLSNSGYHMADHLSFGQPVCHVCALAERHRLARVVRE